MSAQTTTDDDSDTFTQRMKGKQAIGKAFVITENIECGATVEGDDGDERPCSFTASAVLIGEDNHTIARCGTHEPEEWATLDTGDRHEGKDMVMHRFDQRCNQRLTSRSNRIEQKNDPLESVDLSEDRERRCPHTAGIHIIDVERNLIPKCATHLRDRYKNRLEPDDEN